MLYIAQKKRKKKDIGAAKDGANRATLYVSSTAQHRGLLLLFTQSLYMGVGTGSVNPVGRIEQYALFTMHFLQIKITADRYA